MLGFLLFLFNLSFSTAQALNFGPREYPEQVQLKAALPTRPAIQKYGACHVYAAVVAAQATCYRKTQKVLPLSVGYLFYRHLRTEATSSGNDYFLSNLHDSLFSNNDAGDYAITLNRIQNNSVTLDDEYSMFLLDRSDQTEPNP
jgi:hypothetical protein